MVLMVRLLPEFETGRLFVGGEGESEPLKERQVQEFFEAQSRSRCLPHRLRLREQTLKH